MKQVSLFIASLCYFFPLNAQKAIKQASWQQRTDYKISVELDPEKHLLKGFISIDYTNNSPDTLKTICLHVWPNAYKNTQTAYALQQLRNGKTDFQFSEETEKGWIDSFEFKSNGNLVQWKTDSVLIDVLYITLNEPLYPGKTATLSTPFIEKLPKLFSRGGVHNSFFALTQWYPKPAVYDVNGWNAMPYLEQGEFYSEFGTYDVSITLPSKYLVAATGNLLTESELKALNAVIENNGINKNHSNQLKTLQYHEDNIHDFAWFADTTFRVNKDQIQLKNGDVVNTWVFESKRNGEWQSNESSAIPVSTAVKAYSNKIGNYPYKNCTLVIGSIIAGGGMEYPTITVCDDNSKETTMHEVGHNWFYGMLGTNERTYPWMDESINTFFEQRFSNKLIGSDLFFKNLKGKDWGKNYETMLAYLFSARQGISQPLNLPSDEFSNLNYGSIVYAKGPLLFAYLEQQLGDSLFEQCFKNYFSEWQYKHPLPGDLQSSFERTTGMNLNWFFSDLLNENNNIDLINKKHHKELIGSTALDSFLKSKQYLNANPYGFLPETNYLNNGQKKKWIAINIPFRLPAHNTIVPINLSPVLGYNYYDQLYVGAAIFNRSIFRKKLEYILMPAYAFGSNKLVGYGKINGLFISHSNTIHKIETGVQGQSFGQGSLQSLPNQYYRVNPYFKIFFKHKKKFDEQYSKQLHINLYHTGLVEPYIKNKDTIVGNFANGFFSNYIKATYLFAYKNPINSIKVMANGEYGYNYKFGPKSTEYIKLWIQADYRYQYAKRKYFTSYFFAGSFLHSKGLIGTRKFFLSGNSGNNDYLYNEALLGRNESIFRDGLLGHQIINTNGNMRNVLPLKIGSENWMIASANDINFPGVIPFKFYLDVGCFPYAYGNQTELKPSVFTTLGLSMSLFKETLEIFVPLYQSTQFSKNNLYNLFNYSLINSIGFKLNINQLDPTKIVDDFRM